MQADEIQTRAKYTKNSLREVQENLAELPQALDMIVEQRIRPIIHLQQVTQNKVHESQTKNSIKDHTTDLQESMLIFLARTLNP